MAYVITAECRTPWPSCRTNARSTPASAAVSPHYARKHLTQVQLAQTHGVAQSSLNAYELGQRRVPVSALPVLAKTLSVSLETLMGETDKAAKKRGPTPKLAQHMERISQLPKPRQRFVIQVA